MTITLLIFAAFALLMWLRIALSRIGFHRFLFNIGDNPAKLNGAIARDTVTGNWLVDPPVFPSVTVIVPGRNEGHLLEKTLGSLCAMTYPNFRVVFIDDQSTDNTPAVCDALKMRFANLTVIRNQTPPEKGWVGKVWAVHQARQHAATDYLMFCDSDLHFHPEALTQAMRLALHRQTDLLSVLPRMEVKSAGEFFGVSAGILLIMTAMPLRHVNNPKSKKALAAGGFSLYKRSAYEKVGGHEAVRTQVIEDIALCTRIKAAGLRSFTVMTHDIYFGRMYEGWRDTFRGLKKNAFAGAHYSYLLGAFYLITVTFAVMLLPLYVFAALALWITHPSTLTLIAAVISLAALWLMIAVGVRDLKMLRLPSWLAWLTPISIAFYTCIFISAMLDHARGHAQWAGRKMAAAELKSLKEA
jgi:chlorobactene glucosyltransferase